MLWVGRDGEHLHVIAFDGRGLDDRNLAPGAPLSALVEKIRPEEDVRVAVERLANRASRYAVKRNPNIFRKLNITNNVPV